MTAARVPSEQLPAGPVDGAAPPPGSALAAPRPASGRTGAAPVRPGGGTAARRRPLRAVLRDRRGATALVFAASAVALFGFVALATEGGNWYFNHRNARSAADMAALAGASAYARASGNQDEALSVATDTARRNGFANGSDAGTGAKTTVTIAVEPWTPPASSPYAAVGVMPATVRVTIERQVPTFLAGLFLGSDAVTIRVAARAAVTAIAPACILSLTGSLTIGGTYNVVAPECVLASNNRGNHSIFYASNDASVQARALSASGACFQCGKDRQASPPYYENAPPVDNPFEAIDDFMSRGSRRPGEGTVPACQTTGQIPDNGRVTTSITVRPPPNATATTFCRGKSDTIVVSQGATLTLSDNATYFFYNMSLDVQNGTLNCNNCTLVFTGSDDNSVGKITINANGNGATVQTNIVAPKNNSYNSVFNGVAIYRDALARTRGGTQDVILDGGANVRIGGAMVFPTSTVRWNGHSAVNAGGSTVSCGFLIGGTITLTGNGGYNLGSDAACKTHYGVNAPQVTAVRLLE